MEFELALKVIRTENMEFVCVFRGWTFRKKRFSTGIKLGITFEGAEVAEFFIPHFIVSLALRVGFEELIAELNNAFPLLLVLFAPCYFLRFCRVFG